MTPPRHRYPTHPRLRGFDYTGGYAYHVTVVSNWRRPVLLDHGSMIADRLAQAATATHFDVLVYVVMPDHVHVLAQGSSGASDLKRFVQRFKQLTSYDYKQRSGERLWQPSYHDHVLRRDEDANAVAQYVFDNPVRAGLIERDEPWAYRGGTLTGGGP